MSASLCASDFDTALAVYAGECNSLALLPGGCNDDNGPVCPGTQSSVEVGAAAGTPLLIRIGGHAGAAGTGMLRLGCRGGPPCPADWNGDGAVNSQDFFDFSPTSSAAAPTSITTGPPTPRTSSTSS